MNINDFGFTLPEELIAQEPCEERDHSRLMVVNREGGMIEQRLFFEIIDYLKLDVEGVEIDALNGASELLENKSIRYLQFEISKQMLEATNSKAKDMFDFLQNKGYECHVITDEGNIGEKATDSDAFYDNYIAFPYMRACTRRNRGSLSGGWRP